MLLSPTVSGIVVPPFETICAYHPGFALAMLDGVRARPNLRTIQGVFAGFALNQPIESSFDQQITGYSLFTGCAYTLDPINAFGGNLFQYVSAGAQQLVTGITVDLLIRSRGENDYSPIPTQTPLQMVPTVLDGAVGVWALNEPDNCKMRFTLIAAPAGNPPLTVWFVFSFLVLGEGGDRYLCLDRDRARALLHERGYGPRHMHGGGPLRGPGQGGAPHGGPIAPAQT